MSIFLQELHRYKLNATQNKAEILTLTVAPYILSVDISRHKHMMFLGEFGKIVSNKSAEYSLSKVVEDFTNNIVKNWSLATTQNAKRRW